MANNVFAANIRTGGTAGCLDDIDHNSLSDGDIAIVIDVDSGNDKAYFYQYNAGSTPDAGTAGFDYIDPVSGGTGQWILCLCQSFDTLLRSAMASTTLSGFLTGLKLDKDYIWIPAAAMKATSTNGATLGSNEYATADTMMQYYAFNSTTEQYVDFDLVMPASWDLGTVKAKFYWSNASGASAADTVEWQMQAIAITNDDAIDGQAYTDTGEVISDTVTADGDLHVSGATPAITVNGTPALEDLVHYKVSRNVSGTDDMTEDAWLFGVLIEFAHSAQITAWA
jgi:hypothetical protein